MIRAGGAVYCNNARVRGAGWPRVDTGARSGVAASAARAVGGQPARLCGTEENGATDLLVAGDAAATRLLSAFDAGELDGDDDGAARVARHLRRYLAKRLRESE